MKIKVKSFSRKLTPVVCFLWTAGFALALLLVPARLTAPARTFFLRISEPALKFSFDAAGDAAAASGSLREALMARDIERISMHRLRELENHNRLLSEALYRINQRIEGYNALRLTDPDIAALSADVIAYDTAPGRRSITIAAGRKHGLNGGEAVASAGALAGTISETGHASSRVRLITDPASILPVRSARTRTLYLLRGLDGLSCSLDMADIHQDVQPGDLLVTAVFDSRYSDDATVPSGLPVAEITYVEQDVNFPLLRRIKARPLAELGRIEHVTVIYKEE